jgi:GNAT superfamily N-acetyltransferase
MIRRAFPQESELLTQIAHTSKRHWKYPESWIQSWRAQLTITAEFVATNGVYVIEDEQAVKGFYGLVAKDATTWLEHLWVLPEAIRRGFGRELFNHATEIARKRGAVEIQIESDPNAEGFYLKMGARRSGKVVSTIDGKPRSVPHFVLQL